VPKQPFKKVERRLAGKAALRTDAVTSARMSRIRQAGTEPEMTVRRAVSTLGLRYTVNNKDLPGSPDLANRSRRWAVFVHGCYWHRHAGCYRATTPRTNTEFWLNKFSRNVARDAEARGTLRRKGYKVLTLWQCELDSIRQLSGKLARLAAGARESTSPAKAPGA
jgi:DNA mismatch endonuclease (patch repair protein)